MTVTAQEDLETFWAPARLTEEEHLRLLLTDERWLRQEFEAIIATVWRAEPPLKTNHRMGQRSRILTVPPPGQVHRPGNTRSAGSSILMAADIRAYERSPPQREH